MAFYSGGSLGDMDIFSFTRDASPNIIDETLRLRAQIGLPPHYIFLAEDPAGIVLLDARNNQVNWLGSAEVQQFIKGHAVRDIDQWDDFVHFFKNLLAEQDQA